MKRKQIALVVRLLPLGLADLLYPNLTVLPSLWAGPDVVARAQPPAQAHLPAQPQTRQTVVAMPAPHPSSTAGKEAHPAQGTTKPTTAAALDGTDTEEGAPAPARDVAGEALEETAQLVRETVLHFPPGSWTLTPEHRQRLKDLLAGLNNQGSLRVEIHGHTDRTGAQGFDNQLLSRQRAESVASFLIQNGVEQQRVTISGHGSSRPVDPESNPAAWARNRRAEIQIFKGMP